MREIILVGNPNTGKTTLFNSLTKSSEHTGNWHGVTVDEKKKVYKYHGKEFSVCDLPGVYSLSPLTFEEEVTVKYLYNHQNSLVINIVDINNLSRNLYLTLELIELGIPTILVVNKIVKNSAYFSDGKIKKLYEKLGIKACVVDAQNLSDIEKLKEEILHYFDNLKKNKNNNDFNKNYEKKLKYGQKIENLIKKTANLIEFDAKNTNLNLKYLCLKCLEDDEIVSKKLKLSSEKVLQLNHIKNEISMEEIACQKYKIIDEILEINLSQKKRKIYGKSWLDKYVLNRYLSLPIFVCVLLGVFYFTFFSVGKFFSEVLSSFIQNCVGEFILNLVKSITKSPIILDFFESGIIGGIGSIFSFLPQVIILFLCLGILEDSGYLSRVAFSLDDVFGKIGLSGKSVYTLLMGFGCSTSACMTARTMEDKNSRIKTAMLAPYMSCSAKLPIYVVIGSAFFGASNVFVIFAMYMLGVIIAMLLSVFYEKTFLKSGKQTFILEFPPYRKLSFNRLFSLALDSGKQFMLRVGSVLISVNIIVWVLTSFSFTFSFVKTSGGHSILEVLGGVLSPIFAPLGFGSWGATSALLAGLVAKEVIVSTIALVNGINVAGENFTESVASSLTMPSSAVCFTPASALSYMVFCLLYSPCLATMSVLKKEIGKKWLVISILVEFVVAYLVSMIIFASVNVILNKGIWEFLLLFFAFVVIVVSVLYIYKYLKRQKSCGNCKKCRR